MTKIYCTAANCVWRGEGNHCGWTVCPTGNRAIVRPRAATPAAPETKQKRGRPIIATRDGQERRYQSTAQTAADLGMSQQNVNRAIRYGHKARGWYLRCEEG